MRNAAKEFKILNAQLEYIPEIKDKYRLIKKFDNLTFSEFKELGDAIINAGHIISSYSTTSLEAHFTVGDHLFIPLLKIKDMSLKS